MIPIGLGIAIIIIFIGIAIIYAKMSFIWRDVMLKRNEQNRIDMEKLRKHRESYT